MRRRRDPTGTGVAARRVLRTTPTGAPTDVSAPLTTHTGAPTDASVTS